MPPVEESVVLVEDELDRAQTVIDRWGLDIDWEPAELRLRTVLVQPDTEERFYLQGIFEDYKEHPPVWEFFDEDWNGSGQKDLYPARKPCPFGSSIFHSTPYICAHFNKPAYAGGRHNRWGDPENWRNIEEQNRATATTVGGMLQHIYRHLSASRGRMG